MTAKDPNAPIRLRQTLRDLPGSQGSTLVQNHPYFKGVNILEANKKFQTKKVEDVKKEMTGTELEDDQRDELEKYYKEFY